MRLSISLALASSMLLGAGSAYADGPIKIVATIKPVYSLLTAVTEGTDAQTTLLVKGSSSPHTYSMTPSDAQALQDANVIFWVGPALEHFLTKPLEALGGNAEIITLEQAPNAALLPTREGGAFEADEHDHHDEADHDHDHDHDEAASEDDHDHLADDLDDDGIDPHMWLDPQNARAFVEDMASTLSAADPANAARYQENATAVDKKLGELGEAVKAQLSAETSKPYIVFHDAYQYFGDRFGVDAAGSVTVNPETPPSALRIREIQDKIKSLGAVCVFSEPQFPPKVIQTVTEGSNAYIGTLDPLGADLKDGPDLYFTLIQNMADGISKCFEAK
ncbi:zinc ABC transporter substrate-binding protein [Martelella alba]|uniref:High-affinity zinc uptake system protein ZnuA n=1 Tax=Martelella alba TaxID=2590451 RepID=A0A506UJS0_9HYPH|nr:zinc ABC transporter substrate-binding protein [Martelella alba]TPW33555.1 zinc ABC transporter substrate-binding protein [Martelella alba]